MLAAHSPAPAPWLPSLDLHEDDGELVLHAELPPRLAEGAEVVLEGGVLVVRPATNRGSDPMECRGRLPLPFAARAVRAVKLAKDGGLEIRIAVEDRSTVSP
ncbi:MAG: hypothetical protein ACREI8_14100 [Myxococcota bacterium]